MFLGMGTEDKTGHQAGNRGPRSDAIDGKTIRGSFNTREGQKAIRLVSAWATENRLVFAQVKTGEKHNEITAIPTLLEMTALKGCIVTIDTMGCQCKTADQIVASGTEGFPKIKYYILFAGGFNV